MEKIMSKSNDSSKLGRATNELRDDELQKVSGGQVRMEDILVTSVKAPANTSSGTAGWSWGLSQSGA